MSSKSAPSLAIAIAIAAGLLAAAGLVASAHGQAADAAAGEHQRIAAERAAAEARFGERQRTCLQRFIVTACIDDAKRERRETLTRLKDEQNQLDDSLRHARAAEHAEAIAKRRAAAAQPQGEAVLRKPRESREPREPPEPREPNAPTLRTPIEHAQRSGKSASAASGSPSAPARNAGVRAAGPVAKSESRGEREARSRVAFDAAQRAAEAHRAEVEKRNAQRAAKHKPAPPLPLPPDASVR